MGFITAVIFGFLIHVERQWLSAEERTMLSDEQTQSTKESINTRQCYSNIRALEKKIGNLESELKSCRNENNDLVKKNDALKNEWSTEVRDLKKTNRELQKILDDANTRLKRDDCDESQPSGDVSEKQIDEMKSTLQRCHDERKEQRDVHSPGPSHGKGTSASRSSKFSN